MSYIVSKLSKLRILRADIFVEGWSSGGRLCIEPVSISCGTNSVVSPEDVIRMSDPEAGRCHVSVKATERWDNLDNKIIFNQVLCLCSVLNKEGMTHCSESKVLLNSEVVHSMECHCSVVSVVD
jgi:hypothetical protein